MASARAPLRACETIAAPRPSDRLAPAREVPRRTHVYALRTNCSIPSCLRLPLPKSRRTVAIRLSAAACRGKDGRRHKLSRIDVEHRPGLERLGRNDADIAASGQDTKVAWSFAAMQAPCLPDTGANQCCTTTCTEHIPCSMQRHVTSTTLTYHVVLRRPHVPNSQHLSTRSLAPCPPPTREQAITRYSHMRRPIRARAAAAETQCLAPLRPPQYS